MLASLHLCGEQLSCPHLDFKNSYCTSFTEREYTSILQESCQLALCCTRLAGWQWCQNVWCDAGKCVGDVEMRQWPLVWILKTWIWFYEGVNNGEIHFNKYLIIVFRPAQFLGEKSICFDNLYMSSNFLILESLFEKILSHAI